MRLLRLGLLLGVALILAAVAWDYFDARRAGLSVRLAEPSQMPSHLDAQATRWTWSQSTGDRRSVEGSAARVRQTKDTGVLELDEVELRIFHEGGQSFDLVETRNALFYSRDGRLYSESPVVLTLGLATADEGREAASPTVIRSTRVTFDSKQGTSSTDQPTEYEFKGGRGRSVGALYDSTQGQLLMRSDVYLERFPERAGDPLVKVWAAQLTYHERAGRVELKGGVTLERGPQKLQSAEALVFLEQGLVRRIEGREAHGVDRQPGRTVAFRAPWFEALYAGGLLERASGANPAEIESVTESSVIQANGERIDLHYAPEPGGQASRLREMYSRDKARIELRPGGGGEAGDIRRVSADLIHLVMREDGKEVERIETLTPGKLEILPRDASGPRRVLTADRMTAHYTAGSRMEKLRASGHAALENHPPAKSNAPQEQALLRSWSEELEAKFTPDSGELEWMNQWTNFRFERGRRRGQSQQARFVPAKNELTLENAARVWDAESNISARRILQNDSTGDLLAEGEVSSRYQSEESRQPEESRQLEESKPAQQAGSLFTASQPVFAIADRMVSREAKGEVEYRGGARLWQGEDRIGADRITILRQAGNLSAEGGVKSYLRARENREATSAKQADTSSRMLIQANSLRYEEASRQASYRGETTLRRGDLLIRSEELDAWFTSAQSNGAQSNGAQSGGPQSGGSQTLKEAVARGDVRISEPGADGGVRKGYGREAVYDPTAAVARLRGSPARVVDEAGNETRGPELTYRLNDDRLLVQGKEDDRAYSLRRHNQP